MENAFGLIRARNYVDRQNIGESICGLLDGLNAINLGGKDEHTRHGLALKSPG
jgi:hypothetical protein